MAILILLSYIYNLYKKKKFKINFYLNNKFIKIH